MKITLYMGMTLNGIIAKENDEAPWSQEIWKSYYKITKKFKAIILGRRTYDIMKPLNEFEKIGNPFTLVLSNKSQIKEKNIISIKSPHEAIKILKEKGMKEALLCGGSKVNSSFMKENLIDEIILDIEPMLFGRGIPLLQGDNFEKKLELIKIKKLSKDTIQVHYKVKK